MIKLKFYVIKLNQVNLKLINFSFMKIVKIILQYDNKSYILTLAIFI